MESVVRKARGVRARIAVALFLIAVTVVAQVPATEIEVVSAAMVNSYSTLGTVSYDEGSCGVDNAASVVTSPGIKRIVKASNNEIYVVGCFLNFAGDATADYVAKWNGSSWSGLGSSGDINAIVHDAVIYKGNLHIAGEFENAGGDAAADMVAKWNGSAWVGLPVQGATGGANGTGSPREAASSATDYATALEVQENGAGTSDDVLLVGGRFIYGINDGTGAGFTIANTRNIATWNGSVWAAVTSSNPYPGTTETDMAVRDIVSIGSDIYLGAYRNNSTYVSSRRTYMFLRYKNSTGVWDRPVSTVSQQFYGTGFGIYAMTASGTDIYVGGTFSGLSSVASDLAVYSTTSNSFAAVNGFAAQFGTGAVVRSITSAGSQLFVGGSFPGVTGTSGGVARWTGASWQGIGRNAPSVVNVVLADMAYSGSDNRIFIGASGTDIGGVSTADGLATLALDSTSTLDSMSVSAGTLSPAFNPATTSYTLSIPNASPSVDFTVLASSSGAAIKRINSTGTIALPGNTDTDTLSVAVGATENITFTVAGLSGTGTTAYSVAVTRSAAASSSSSSVPPSSSSSVAPSSSTTEAPPASTTSSTAVPTGSNTGATSTVSNVVKHGATASKTTLLKLAKTSVPSGGKYALKIASTYAKVCKVSGTGVKTLKAGTCKVSITITPKAGRASTKTVTLKVT